MIRMLGAVAAGAILVATAAAAAEPAVPKLPQSGKARFEVIYFRAGPSHAVELNEQTGFGSFEQYGVTRNVDGQPWFDRMTEYCTGQYYDAAGQTPAPTNGACVYVDLDGDKVVINWVDQGEGGTKQIVAGTGKYSGITGKGSYKLDAFLTPPTETSNMLIVDVELDFQIKGATQ